MRKYQLILFGILSILLIFTHLFFGNPQNENQNLSGVSLIHETLYSLGYLEWSKIDEQDIDKIGITKTDVNHPIKNTFITYKTRYKKEIYIINSSGVIVRAFHLNISGGPLHNYKILSDGNFITIQKDYALTKISPNSKIFWILNLSVHHDAAEDKKGNIYAIYRKPREVTLYGENYFILDDSIIKFSPNGEFLYEKSLFDLFWSNISQSRLKKIKTSQQGILPDEIEFIPDNITDVFHANSIEIIDKDVGKIFEKGDILISIRDIDTIAVLDKNTFDVKWMWSHADLERQHSPSMTDDGNIVIFDNGIFQGYSRVITVNPKTRTIIWEYNPKDPKVFFSAKWGDAQPIWGNHFLITESSKGRIFILDGADNDIIWEYYNPDVIRNKRGGIFTATKLTPIQITQFNLE